MHEDVTVTPAQILDLQNLEVATPEHVNCISLISQIDQN